MAKRRCVCFATHRPDITLMDLRMPKANGIDAITAIRKEWPTARIIVLTTYGGDVQALRAFKAGASGYLLKSMLRTELIDTIRLVHAGHRRIPQEIAVEMAEHVADDALTSRELETLRGVASGSSNKIIAEQSRYLGAHRQRTSQEHSLEARRQRSYARSHDRAEAWLPRHVVRAHFRLLL